MVTLHDICVCMIHTILEFIPMSSSAVLALFTNNTDIWHGYAAISSSVVLAKDFTGMILNSTKRNFLLVSVISTLLTIGLLYNFIIPITPSYVSISAGIALMTSLLFIDNRSMEYSLVNGILIGVCQAMPALFPGASRMGCVLTYLFLRGFSIKDSIKTTILLGIPLNFLLLFKSNISLQPILIIISILTAYPVILSVLQITTLDIILITLLRIALFFSLLIV